MAGHRHGRARPHLRAHRVGQDAGRVPVGPRPPRRRPDAGATRTSGSSTSPRSRHSRTTSSATSAPRCAGSAGTSHPRSGSDGRHAAARARADAAHAARHPHHDARVALPPAHLAGARGPDAGRCRHRRRDPRRRGDEARVAPRPHARAPPARCRRTPRAPPATRLIICGSSVTVAGEEGERSHG